jgi:hypothetical protein
VGGGANIPMVTTTLSAHLKVPVVTTPRPQLAAASGGALRATRDLPDNNPTALVTAAAQTAPAPAARMAWPAAPAPSARMARPAPPNAPAWSTTSTLSWSDAGDSRFAADGTGTMAPHPAEGTPSQPSETKHPEIPWYRRALPPIAILGAAVALLLVGAALGTELRSEEKATTPTTSVPAPPSATSSATPQAPPSSSTPNPPATTDPPTTTAPPAAPQVTEPPPAPAPPPPAAPAAVPAPAAPPAPAAAPAPASATPIAPWLRVIPSLPRIPGLNAPIPGLSGIPSLESLLAERGYSLR